jgi:hypothetical protein
MSRVIAETHGIKAGGNFDGTTPTTDADLDYGELNYAPHTAGGLFILPPNRVSDVNDDPEVKKQVRRIKSIRVTFGGQTTWSLTITGGEGGDYLWLAGTTESSLVVTDNLNLLPSEKLKLVTSGASTAMTASVDFELVGTV